MRDYFDKCVVRSLKGRRITCKLGLWSVQAPTAEQADSEARHYWIQYYDDGEYHKLLGLPVDVKSACPMTQKHMQNDFTTG